MSLIKKFFQNEIFSYLFWGGTITAVNFLVFYFLNLFIDYKLAEIFAMVSCRVYGYVVNKKFVFHSKCKDKKECGAEIVRFIFFRGITGTIDFFVMILLVSYFEFQEIWAKIIVTFIVIVLNYIFGKFLVFNKK